MTGEVRTEQAISEHPSIYLCQLYQLNEVNWNYYMALRRYFSAGHFHPKTCTFILEGVVDMGKVGGVIFTGYHGSQGEMEYHQIVISGGVVSTFMCSDKGRSCLEFMNDPAALRDDLERLFNKVVH